MWNRLSVFVCDSQLSEEVKSSPVAASFELTPVWISSRWCHDLAEGARRRTKSSSVSTQTSETSKQSAVLLGLCARRGVWGHTGRSAAQVRLTSIYVIPISDKAYVSLLLAPHGSFIGSARVGTSLHGPVWIWMLQVGLEQSLHYADGVSCISMLFIHVFSPSGGKTKHYPLLCHCIDQHVVLLYCETHQGATSQNVDFILLLLKKHPIITARRADVSLKGLFAYSPKEFCDSSEFLMITRRLDRVNRSH